VRSVGAWTGGLGLLLIAAATAGCGFFSPTVGVDRAGAKAVYESLNSYALNSDELSASTREVLHSYGMTELADDDMDAAVRALHARTLADPRRGNLFALAEMTYLRGEHRADRDDYLASAVYAWLYLFGHEDPIPASPYERRFRWACELYNAAVLRAFANPEGGNLSFDDGDRALPVGRLHVTVDRSRFPWTLEQYSEFVPGDVFLIEGLSLRLRDSGIGVPLIGLPKGDMRVKMPASMLLRPEGGLADLEHGIPARLEFFSVIDAPTLQVGDQTVPLETDISVSLAYTLHESPMWKFSLTGLFQGEAAVKENRLIMVRPCQRGRIPVVFVHGTASNPAYWAEMFNTLVGDPELRRRMQVWLFQYSSGNPIVFSAATLRQKLIDAVAAADPDGTDPALRQMVLIGHSQGGLIVKLLTVDGSLDWLEEATGKPFDQLGFDEQQAKLVRDCYDFKAVPTVKRAVFICTPHGGSFRADSWYSRMIAKFIALPGEVQGLGNRLLTDDVKLPPELAGRLPTALDNMNPNSPILKQLHATPIAPGIVSHTIIAIGDADEHDPASLAEADDGVVQYSCARLDGVESELLVHAMHSCQDNPLVIQEVRRILHEVLDQQ
jgi:pimeloyl-ACP methyl ester carboxylesterase